MRKEPGTDFLNKKNLDIQPKRQNLSQEPPKKKKKVVFFATSALILFGLIFTQQVFFSSETVPALQDLTRLPVIREIRQLTGASDHELKGSISDRINVLILGQGGPGHPGPFLTDTIMLASIKLSTGQIGVLSIPRDMVVDIPDQGLDRINAANSIGETTDYPGGGANLAARVLEKTINLPINYYVRIDFAAFAKAIDDLGGIEINIERAFTDYQYPDNNLGYEVVRFNAGEQVLNGEQALKYVRSRHADGEAGDFARVKRQQNLLLTVKDKLLEPGNLINPSRVIGLYKDLSANVSTNIQVWEIPKFFELAKKINFDNVSFKVLDDSPAGPLYATTLENGAYVLAPKLSDYSEIEFIAKNIFTINDIQSESTRLVIQNGTTEEGLAINTAAILASFEFEILKIGNAPTQNFQKTLLFDLTGDTKKKSKMFLESALQTKSLNTLPVSGEDFGEADFVIMLGADQIPSQQVNLQTKNSQAF